MKFRRLMDNPQDSTSIIATGTSFTGEITGKGDFVIYGQINGDCDVDGSLTVAVGGLWKGTINATNILIAGQVDGDVNASARLEVTASARVTGRISAASIALAEGAIIDGNVNVMDPTEVLSFKEKRKRELDDKSPVTKAHSNAAN
jgi:cytoskeletal protein CcmA (bactofilin family)